jgi:hypothetical protein
MNRRSHLDTARRRLIARIRQVADRVIIRGPLSEADRRRAEELVKERGWNDEDERSPKHR